MLDRSGSSRVRSQGDVSAFALQALAALIEDIGTGKTEVNVQHLRRLKIAVHAVYEKKLDDALDAMRAAGITNREIIGLYVPAVARALGEDWLSDRMDFVGVTIASSRLQGIVRRLAADCLTPHSNAPRCLVVVPYIEQHTLGASILTSQLREQGLDVQLLLRPDPDQLAELTRSGGFNAIMISSSDRNNLEPLRTMIKTLRTNNTKVPILVGGTVLEHTGDVCRLVRADYATNNLQEAIRICGLKSHTPMSSHPAKAG
ncbi:cobalamin B12-binding domain-containing protein [Yoonia sp. 208BN28-4]|uniref:cobalamin B12-binding domain-containing protein n=1 Tax=Yoonia sp. 208BN28-4 TaxID=3126505 RepID=UPI0030961662